MQADNLQEAGVDPCRAALVPSRALLHDFILELEGRNPIFAAIEVLLSLVALWRSLRSIAVVRNVVFRYILPYARLVIWYHFEVLLYIVHPEYRRVNRFLSQSAPSSRDLPLWAYSDLVLTLYGHLALAIVLSVRKRAFDNWSVFDDVWRAFKWTMAMGMEEETGDFQYEMARLSRDLIYICLIVGGRLALQRTVDKRFPVPDDEDDEEGDVAQ